MPDVCCANCEWMSIEHPDAYCYMFEKIPRSVDPSRGCGQHTGLKHLPIEKRKKIFALELIKLTMLGVDGYLEASGFLADDDEAEREETGES